MTVPYSTASAASSRTWSALSTSTTAADRANSARVGFRTATGSGAISTQDVLERPPRAARARARTGAGGRNAGRELIMRSQSGVEQGRWVVGVVATCGAGRGCQRAGGSSGVRNVDACADVVRASSIYDG